MSVTDSPSAEMVLSLAMVSTHSAGASPDANCVNNANVVALVAVITATPASPEGTTLRRCVGCMPGGGPMCTMAEIRECLGTCRTAPHMPCVPAPHRVAHGPRMDCGPHVSSPDTVSTAPRCAKKCTLHDHARLLRGVVVSLVL